MTKEEKRVVSHAADVLMEMIHRHHCEFTSSRVIEVANALRMLAEDCLGSAEIELGMNKGDEHAKVD